MKITKENYIKEMRRRNEDALEFVVATYGGLIKAAINRILYDYTEDAEECLYDTILKIWNNIDSYDNDRPFEGWAAAIAKHAALDRLRRLKKLQPLEDIDTVTVPDTSGLTGNNLFDEFFSELISCLGDDDKALFIRIFWNGENVSEASYISGMSKSVIHNRISRGKKKIIKSNPGLFNKEA